MQSPVDPATLIARIDALTAGARTTWFAYLGVLVFVAVTLFGIRDIDFFVQDVGVQLPLVGVTVPIATFVLASAVLITTINGYLHVVLDEVWAALAAAPARFEDGRRLAVAMPPWLVTSFALHLRGALRAEEERLTRPSTLGRLGAAVTFALLFLAGPLLLASLWLVSQPAHEAWLTLSVGLLAVIAGAMNAASLASLVREMRRTPPRRARLSVALGVVLAALVAAVSLARTTWDPMGPGITRHPDAPGVATSLAQWFRPAIADLRLARITRLTRDWTPHEEASAAFARAWCGGRDDASACREMGFSDRAFLAAYRRHRARALAVLKKPDLSDRHMDHADFALAFLPGVSMNRARLRRADFESAVIEGVSAQRADLINAVLIHADAALIDFRRATLDGADMFEIAAPAASFVSARLRGATLSESDLRHALFNAADLTGARLRDARLDGARMHRATLARADLQGATLTGAELVQANFAGARLERARIGRATISSVDFSGAALISLMLDHDGRFWFGRTDFTGARMLWVAFRNADMSRARFSGAEALAYTFGDGSVRLPEGMQRPCHWVDEVLGDDAFHARWRGLTQATNLTPVWQGMAELAFDDVEPVSPPAACVFPDIDVRAGEAWQRRFRESRAALLEGEP